MANIHAAIILPLTVAVFAIICAAASKEKLLNKTPKKPIASGVGIVNVANVRQKIDGFGWASAFIANISDLAFDSLFLNDAPNNPSQMGLHIHRVMIAHNVSWEAEMLYAQKARQRGAIVFATVLTPPPELKTSNNASGGELRPDKYAAYAAYLKNISDYYSSNNVSLYAISVQNTPDVAKYKNVSYQYCSWTAQQLLNFVKNYGDKVGTKLLVAESYAFDQKMTDPILNDVKAAANVAIVGGQIYGGGLAKYPLAQAKGKSVWMTENTNGSGNDSDIRNVLATAKDVHDCMTIGEHNAYVTFETMVGDQGPSLRGYGYGQFSKHIRPGFQRVDATSSPAKNVFLSAYKGGKGKVVLVAINMNTVDVKQQFAVHGAAAKIASSFTPYLTMAEGSATDAVVNVSGSGAFSYKLPAQSITTMVSN